TGSRPPGSSTVNYVPLRSTLGEVPAIRRQTNRSGLGQLRCWPADVAFVRNVFQPHVVLLIALIGAPGCRPGERSSAISFDVVLETTFGGAAESSNAPKALLASITSVEVDTLSRVYVLDAPPGGRARLVSFTPGGDVRWTVDVQGSGPGELRYPYGFAYDGDSMLVVGN